MTQISLMKYCSTLFVAMTLMAMSAIAASIPIPAHVPLYRSNVIEVRAFGPDMWHISTKDSPVVVIAWYRKHLRDQSGEFDTIGGFHRFRTHNGAYVNVTPPDRSHRTTWIGIVDDHK